jgi:hypothetical protein
MLQFAYDGDSTANQEKSDEKSATTWKSVG